MDSLRPEPSPVQPHGPTGRSRAPALLRATAAELVELLRADACLVSRVVGELLVEIAAFSRSDRLPLLGQGFLIPDFPLTQEVVERCEPRFVSLHDATADPAETALLQRLGYTSLAMLPLLVAGQCWALVEVYRSGSDAFTVEDARTAAPLLERTGAALAELVGGSPTA